MPEKISIEKFEYFQDHPLLIIGGGLSGFSLALHCHFKGIDYRIIAPQQKNQSSLAAAGIYNPIVFKRMNLSWKADVLIPYLTEFYSKAEKIIGSKFLHPIDILRPISQKDKEVFWIKRSKEETGRFSKIELEERIRLFENSISSGRVIGSGWVDTVNFLNGCREFFKDKIVGINHINLSDVEYNTEDEHRVSWNSKPYSSIIFAEGYSASTNPLWSWLPWKLAKGEVFKIRFRDIDITNYLLSRKAIISKDIFILPQKDSCFRVGSNYEWEYKDSEPSAIGEQYINTKLREILGEFEYDILEHKAGIRPTVADRRPFLGHHPEYKKLFILNGFGSKGVMLAPYFSEQLLDSIVLNSSIEPEASIERFPKRFRNLYDSLGARSALS